MTDRHTDKHIAYMDSRYRYTDDNDVDVFTEEYPVYCGSTDSHGGTVMCAECEAQAKKDYPQGWKYYPGDVCVHGVYTGGCGIDWMCQLCENGEYWWVDAPEYQLMVTINGGAPSDVPAVNRWMEGGMNHKWDVELPAFFNSQGLNDPEVIRLLNMEWYALKISSGYWTDEEPTN